MRVLRPLYALVAPFATLSVLLLLTKVLHGALPARGAGHCLLYAFIAVSAIVGFTFLRRLETPLLVALGAVYFPLMAYALFYYAFYFAGLVFEDWL